MKSIKQSILTGLGLLAACHVANATLTFNATIGGAPVAGSSVITFDTFVPLNDSTATATINYGPGTVDVSFVTDAQAVQGSASSYAAPWAGGVADPTTYLTSGKVDGSLNGQAILKFNTSQNYFGLLWGSVDTYNYLTFYSGNAVVGTLQGSQVLASNGSIVAGNQGANGTAYVNIFSDVAFDKVIATSNPNYAFEFDNVAVPEPTTMIAGALLLLPFGASTLRFVRKNRVA